MMYPKVPSAFSHTDPFMHRYALLMEYDGTQFCGFQRQKDAPSVQEFLERTIARMTKHPVTIHVSGRTDTHVHALGQVAHFESEHPLDAYKVMGMINHYGRACGVCVHECTPVQQDFHARFSARSRSYVYVILNRTAPSALHRQRCAYVRPPLNIDAMREASNKLLGRHNFESFRSSHCQAKHAVRTLDTCDVEKHGAFLIIHVRSKSFVHNQVRIMCGTLMHIGLGKKDPCWIDTLFEVCDRRAAGPTAPAHGLYFRHVSFEHSPFTVQTPSLFLCV